MSHFKVCLNGVSLIEAVNLGLGGLPRKEHTKKEKNKKTAADLNEDTKQMHSVFRSHFTLEHLAARFAR